MVRGKWSGLALHTRITAMVLIDVQIVNPLASTSIICILTICVEMGSLDLSISDSFCINSEDTLWLVSTGDYLMESTVREARRKIWSKVLAINPQMITRCPRSGKGRGSSDLESPPSRKFLLLIWGPEYTLASHVLIMFCFCYLFWNQWL